MKVAIIYNKSVSQVINQFGMQNKEVYNPKTVKRVAKCLEEGGHNVDVIDGDMHVIERIQNFMPKVIEGEKMGMVFNMAYGIQGESRYTHIPSMLEMLGIPYVGSSPTGHALALDKVITKIILLKHGIPTPEFWVFSDTDVEKEEVIFPVIVKPKMESVSFGLRVVDNYKDLKDAVEFILKEFEQSALVERFIPGREFCVGLLGNNPVEAFPVLEIDLENNPNAIQTVDDKMKKPKAKICPAKLDETKTAEMIHWSKEAFKALQLKDFARVDFRMDADGNIYILELNSMASLGATGSYPFAANVAGYDYRALVNKMLDVAALRYFTSASVEPESEQTYKAIPVHVKIRGFIRGRQNNYEKILKQMVNLSTHVRNVEGVNDLGNIVKKNLSMLGFTHQTFPQVEIGNIQLFTNSDDEEYDILLLGNLDNKARVSDHEYFDETEQKIFGTGVWENKGGLVVTIAALQSLRFVKILKKLKIGILLTTDDTLQGKVGAKIIKKISNDAKYVLGLHGAFLNGGLVTSRSGAAVYKFQMNLKKTDDASHVAEAISAFTKIISGCADLSNAEKGLVVAPSEVEINSNITDPYVDASARISVRFNDTHQMHLIDQKIKNLVSKRRSRLFTFHLEGGIRRPSMEKKENVIEFWKIIKKISDQLDINLREEHRWSSADICYVDENKLMIDGMGPVGTKPSNKSEYILRHSLLERSTLLAMTLKNLLSTI